MILNWKYFQADGGGVHDAHTHTTTTTMKKVFDLDITIEYCFQTSGGGV